MFAPLIYVVPAWVAWPASDHTRAAAGWIALNTLALVVSAVCVIGVAELAVAATARALGDFYPFLRIGFGPVIIKRRLFSASVAVSAVPLGPQSCVASCRRDGQLLRAGLAIG